MNENTGTLIGLGVGPGDPELITLKAIHILQKAQVLAVPAKVPDNSTAFQIAKEAVPEISEKTIMGLDFPMTRDQNAVDRAMNGNEERLRAVLDHGSDVVFLTLGDPTIYSAFYRIAPMLQRRGYPIKTVSGITSFCAVASATGIPLVTGNEVLTVYPKIPDKLTIGEETAIFMKPGSKIGWLKEAADPVGKRTERDGYGSRKLRIGKSESLLPCRRDLRTSGLLYHRDRTTKMNSSRH